MPSVHIIDSHSQDWSAPDVRVPVASPCMPPADRITPYLERIDQSGWYSNFGPLVCEFESRLAARFSPVTHVVSVANGTLGLALALEAMGLPDGALCAVPSWTFVATAHAVRMARLTPWLVDVSAGDGELTPDGLAAQLSAAPGPVAAAIPVSVMGRPLDAGKWKAFEAMTGVRILIDAAAGFDTARDASSPIMVSLHATKALGIGEGAFIATEDEALAQRIRALTNFGFLGDRISRHVATNAKLSEYAAAVGLAALELWPEVRAKYIAVARRLRMSLADEGRVIFQPGWGLSWISSTCVVRLPAGLADPVESGLRALGVDTRRWWGEGCHRAPAFEGCPSAPLSQTEALSASTLGIPFFAAMSDGQIRKVVSAIRTSIQNTSSRDSAP